MYAFHFRQRQTCSLQNMMGGYLRVLLDCNFTFGNFDNGEKLHVSLHYIYIKRVLQIIVTVCTTVTIGNEF